MRICMKNIYISKSYVKLNSKVIFKITRIEVEVHIMQLFTVKSHKDLND